MSTSRRGKRITEVMQSRLVPCGWHAFCLMPAWDASTKAALGFLSPEGEGKDEGTLREGLGKQPAAWLIRVPLSTLPNPPLCPGKQMTKGCAEHSQGTQPLPRAVLGSCAAWLWARVRPRGRAEPKGSCLWEIRAGKGHGLLLAQDPADQRLFLSQDRHVPLFPPSFWMVSLV